MGQAAKKNDIDTLLGESEALKRVSVQDLEATLAMEVSQEDILFFNDDGTIGRNEQVRQLFEGRNAMKFLGLPERPHNVLTKGDLSRIRWKFKSAFDKWISENVKGRNENSLFWDQMRVRVVNKKYAGKPTRACPAAGIPAGVYTGDILTGEAIKTFLPETVYSNAKDNFIIQLLSISVTEELLNV